MVCDKETTRNIRFGEKGKENKWPFIEKNWKSITSKRKLKSSKKHYILKLYIQIPLFYNFPSISFWIQITLLHPHL